VQSCGGQARPEVEEPVFSQLNITDEQWRTVMGREVSPDQLARRNRPGPILAMAAVLALAVQLSDTTPVWDLVKDAAQPGNPAV
jgi:hypothetical protein